MKVLLLSPYQTPVANEIRKHGDDVVQTDEKLDMGTLDDIRPDFIVSFGYKHIIRKNILSTLVGRIINLHISLLPWNRGYHPNFWSWAEETPAGVSIHLIDEGIDTGDILFQRHVIFDCLRDETLATTYARLIAEMEQLFAERWGDIRRGAFPLRQQPHDSGSFHLKADLQKFEKYLHAGWNTPVLDIKGIARQ